MDWTAILTALIAALVPTGGVTAIVTLRDKKTAAFLENAKTIIDHWMKIAEERTQRAEELKGDLDRKESIIQGQWKEISELRNELDDTRTHRAVAEILKCEKTDCDKRQPPFGQGQQVQCRLIDKEKEKNNGDKRQGAGPHHEA